MNDNEIVLVVCNPKDAINLSNDIPQDALLITTLMPEGEARTIRKADFMKLIEE